MSDEPLDEEAYQRARQRAVTCVTAAMTFEGRKEDDDLSRAMIDTIVETVPSLSLATKDFSEICNLVSCLSTWVAGGFEREADERGMDPQKVWADFVTFLREED